MELAPELKQAIIDGGTQVDLATYERSLSLYHAQSERATPYLWSVVKPHRVADRDNVVVNVHRDRDTGKLLGFAQKSIGARHRGNAGVLFIPTDTGEYQSLIALWYAVLASMVADLVTRFEKANADVVMLTKECGWNHDYDQPTGPYDREMRVKDFSTCISEMFGQGSYIPDCIAGMCERMRNGVTVADVIGYLGDCAEEPGVLGTFAFETREERQEREQAERQVEIDNAAQAFAKQYQAETGKTPTTVEFIDWCIDKQRGTMDREADYRHGLREDGVCAFGGPGAGRAAVDDWYGAFNASTGRECDMAQLLGGVIDWFAVNLPLQWALRGERALAAEQASE